PRMSLMTWSRKSDRGSSFELLEEARGGYEHSFDSFREPFSVRVLQKYYENCWSRLRFQIHRKPWLEVEARRRYLLTLVAIATGFVYVYILKGFPAINPKILIYAKKKPSPLKFLTQGPGGRRALELILSGGLKSLARPAKPVRRAASRDSVLSQPQPLLEGMIKYMYVAVVSFEFLKMQDFFLHRLRASSLRKCSTVLALTDREKVSEPIRPHNRLRAPSVCSRCSSLLSLAGAGGSRYSLDGAAGGFVPAAPVHCKLCLEEHSVEKVTVLAGCGCMFCTRVSC
ncbi:putative ubiquitin conjugating enzyme 7 interacting protein, partial [Operophtera brumata]